MTAKDLECYRVNYSKADWTRGQQLAGWIYLPAGILDAIEALCKEVERLQNKRKSSGGR